MNKRIVTSSDFINGNFIKEVEPKLCQGSKRKRLRRQVLLRCLCCGKTFKVDLQNALRIQQKCCCIQCSKNLEKDLECFHEKHPLYSRWLSMRQRCYNSNNTNAKNYKDRGIEIEPYLQDFKQYVSYVSSLPNYIENPSKYYQLDRIDNSRGYYRGNLRWVDLSIQSVNKRPSPKKHWSKHIGISFNKRTQKWCARVNWKGQQIYSKNNFTSEEEAFKARCAFIKEHSLPHLIM